MNSSVKLAFITSIKKNSQTGGANAVNYHIYRQLQKHFECTYFQINPPEVAFSKYISKLRRKILHVPGEFSFFSENRLNKIKVLIEAIHDNYDLLFFRGFTPWINTHPSVPYFAYNDGNFQTFFENTFNYRNFKSSHIQKIFKKEADWLSNAAAVFYESTWGKQKSMDQYGLSGHKQYRIGCGGHIELPKRDDYSGSFNLLMIANNFYQKGGDLVYETFKKLKPKYPNLCFHIIGGNPGDNVLNTERVIYHGFLRKENKTDLDKLISLLSNAFLLMHPTREDMNPLVITEAGYFGCPSISVNHFAIPELVKHKETGILLPYNHSTDTIAEVIESLIQDKVRYKQMRKTTWEFNHSQFSWDMIGQKMYDHIKKSF